MLLWYGVVGALGVFYVAVVGVWAWTIMHALVSRKPALVRRRAFTAR
jgi:hypothetical protein